MAKIAITGCYLVDEVHQVEINGDLWTSGDQWVFNAVGEFSPYAGIPSRPMYLTYHPHSNYFERRNVFVIPKIESRLSKVAAQFLVSSPFGSERPEM
jgi:hypothetical protein